jgi:ribosomal protein L15
VQAGFISASQKVKILAKGSLSANLHVVADAFSAAAVKAIEAAGGKAQLVSEFTAPPQKEENKAIEE